MITDTERWLKQAQHDLDMASKNYQFKGYDICLILCQQSIEKFLKALFIHQKNKFPPRTHSFKKLAELLNLPKTFLEEIIEIETYYTLLRYPDISDKMPYENCTKEDAKIGLQKAEMVKNFINNKIK